MMTTKTTTTPTTMARQPSTHTTTTSSASGPSHGLSFKDRLAMFERTGDGDTQTKATRQKPVVHTPGGGAGAHTTFSAPPAGPRAEPVPTSHHVSFKDRLAMFESTGDGDMSIKALRQKPLVHTPGRGAGTHITSSVPPTGPPRKEMIPTGLSHGVSFKDRLAMFERPTAEAVETKEEVAEAATPHVSLRRAVRGREVTATTAAAGTLLSTATAVSQPLLGPPTAAQSRFSRLVPRRTLVTASQPLLGPPTASRPRFSRLVSRCTFETACMCHPWLTRGQHSSAPPGGVSVGPPLAELPQSVAGSAIGVGG